MSNINRVVLVGNLTRDIDLRVTPSGKSVTTLRIAVNRRWKRDSGDPNDNADYFNVVVWGKLAELCNQYIGKGNPIAVDGRLQSRSWETQEGQRRSTVEVVAESIQFLGRPTGGSKAQGGENKETYEPEEQEKEEEVMTNNEDIPF